MSQFIESIRVENGVVYALNYHQKRVNKTFKQFFSDAKVFSLAEAVGDLIIPQMGMYKLRIIYDAMIHLIELVPYVIPTFHGYELIEIEKDFTYSFKSTDRKLFDEVASCVKKGVLPILTQNKFICESTFTNVIFEKNNELFTPNSALLVGTMLQQVIAKHDVTSISIHSDDICLYDKIYPINAMNPLGQIKAICIKK